MLRYEGVVISLWNRMQLMRRLQALRTRGLKVKRRGWLLVIEGGKPKKDCFFEFTVRWERSRGSYRLSTLSTDSRHKENA